MFNDKLHVARITTSHLGTLLRNLCTSCQNYPLECVCVFPAENQPGCIHFTFSSSARGSHTVILKLKYS